MNNSIAKVFVTTYAIGNEHGFGFGKWFDLNEFCDKEDFIAHALEFAETELNDKDPELCFADYETDLPSDLINEYGIDASVWNLLKLDENEMDIVTAYLNIHGRYDDMEAIIENALDCYLGQYENDVDFVYEIMDGHSVEQQLSETNRLIASNIDWKGVAIDVMHDYYSCDGYYFNA